MELTSKEAIELLEKSRGILKTDDWITHSVCVGNCAEIISKALKLDQEYAKTLGYIHDIGKQFDTENNSVLNHAKKGYDYIKSLGYDEKYAGICIKHSFLNNDINCLANFRDETDKSNCYYEFVKEYISEEYSIYDKIINLCDLMCNTKVYTVEKRMIDLLLRHGIYANSHYHLIEVYKLKEYFNKLLGYNLYDLFPEIKNNL